MSPVLGVLEASVSDSNKRN